MNVDAMTKRKRLTDKPNRRPGPARRHRHAQYAGAFSGAAAGRAAAFPFRETRKGGSAIRRTHPLGQFGGETGNQGTNRSRITRLTTTASTPMTISIQATAEKSGPPPYSSTRPPNRTRAEKPIARRSPSFIPSGVAFTTRSYPSGSFDPTATLVSG